MFNKMAAFCGHFLLSLLFVVYVDLDWLFTFKSGSRPLSEPFQSLPLGSTKGGSPAEQSLISLHSISQSVACCGNV